MTAKVTKILSNTSVQYFWDISTNFSNKNISYCFWFHFSLQSQCSSERELDPFYVLIIGLNSQFPHSDTTKKPPKITEICSYNPLVQSGLSKQMLQTAMEVCQET